MEIEIKLFESMGSTCNSMLLGHQVYEAIMFSPGTTIDLDTRFTHTNPTVVLYSCLLLGKPKVKNPLDTRLSKK